MVGTEILARYCSSAPDLKEGLMRYSAGNRKLAEKVFAARIGTYIILRYCLRFLNNITPIAANTENTIMIL